MTKLRIVAISDTHLQCPGLDIPECDVLIHAGDATGRGRLHEVTTFADWYAAYKNKAKWLLFTAGNHDWLFQREPDVARQILEERGIHYLLDDWIVIEGVKFYGSPWQPWFHDWAFNLERGEPLRKIWDKIPADTDILLTHSPPMGYLDQNRYGEHCGCRDLTDRILEIKPRFSVFGHIHEGYGRDSYGGIEFINASICDGDYKAVNKPIYFEVEGRD